MDTMYLWCISAQLSSINMSTKKNPKRKFLKLDSDSDLSVDESLTDPVSRDWPRFIIFES